MLTIASLLLIDPLHDVSLHGWHPHRDVPGRSHNPRCGAHPGRLGV